MFSPNYTLSELNKLDDRIDAHLDGLRIAGDDAWPFVREEMSRGEPDGSFVATVLTVDSPTTGRFEELASALRDVPSVASGVISGIAWDSSANAAELLGMFASAPGAIVRAVGIAGSIANGLDVQDVLRPSLQAEDPQLRAHALTAVGQLERKQLASLVVRGLDDPDADCRFAAAWAAIRLGEDAGLQSMVRIASGDDRNWELAAELVARNWDHGRVLELHDVLSRDAATRRAAIVVAGSLGDPALVPWLMDLVASDVDGPLAREAFSMLTGADLPQDVLADALDADEEGGGPSEEDVVRPSADPPPTDYDPTLVREWWSSRSGEFRRGQRYLGGHKIGSDELGRAVVGGSQRLRRSAAMECLLKDGVDPRAHCRF